MTVQRYLVENNGSNQENIKSALAHAYSLCKDEGLKNITLIFPIKGTFTSSDIAKFLGNSAAKDLVKGKSINLGDGINLNFDIPKNISTFKSYDVLLGAYLGNKDIDILDGIGSVNSIVFLPWNEQDGKRWLSTWSPHIVGNSSWVVSNSPLPENIKSEILRIGRSINMSTGLAHPSDKAMVQCTFSELSQQGCTVSSESIRQFAVNNGWEPKRAQELALLAAKYFE